MQRMTAMLLIVACAASLTMGSCGGGRLLGGLLSNKSAEAELASLRLEVPASDWDGATSAQVSMTVEETEYGLIVRLCSAGRQLANQVLCNVYYDPDTHSPIAVEHGDALGGPDQAVQLSISRVRGIIALGEVRHRLETVSLADQQPLAEIRFARGACKATAAFAASDPGMKLKTNVQFDNLDVRFKVVSRGESVYEVVWEEALGGDYNHDGGVTVSDLTPLGAHCGEYLVGSTVDPEAEFYGESPPYSIKRTEDIVCVRNISHKPHMYDPTDAHKPVSWYDVAPTPPVGVPTFEADVTDIAQIGQNFQNQIKSYEIFAITCPPGGVPEDGLLVPFEQLPCLATVKRPGTFKETMTWLGMSEYDNASGNKTYSEFCENDCGQDPEFKDRGQHTPLRNDFRLFRKRVKVQPLQEFGDSYMAIVPRPGNENVPEPAPGGCYPDLGAFTYYKYLQLSETLEEEVPEGIRWPSGNVGLEHADFIQRGSTGDWPEGREHMVRLHFDEAEFYSPSDPAKTHDDYADLGWEVRYALFYGTDIVDMWDTDPGTSDPQMQGVPAVKRYAEFLVEYPPLTYDIVRPTGWLVLPNVKDYSEETLHYGIRAYAYKSYSSIPRRVAGLDENTYYQSIVFPERGEEQPDSDPPYGVSGITWNSLLGAAYTLTNHTVIIEPDPDDPYQSMVAHVLVPLRRPHHLRDSASPPPEHMGIVSCSKLHFVQGLIGDLDGEGDSRPLHEIELRCEIVRTPLQVGEYQNLVDIHDPQSFLVWRQQYLTNPSDVHGVLMDYPTLLPDTPFLALTSTVLDTFAWVDAGTSLVICNVGLCPPMFGSCANTDDELSAYYADHFPDLPSQPTTLDGSWPYSSELFEIADFTAWRAYDGSVEPKCSTAFISSDEPLRVVFDEEFEVLPSGVHYNYLAVLAANDPADNCTYETTATWLGQAIAHPFDPNYLIGRDPDGLFLGEYAGYARLDPSLQSKSPQKLASEVGSPLAAYYPDIAVDEVNERVGITCYDNAKAKVLLLETPTALVGGFDACYVDDATVGDTSIVYDTSGSANVAYVRLSGGDGDPIGVDYGRNTSSTAHRTSSGSATGGVCFRKRLGASWLEREEVSSDGAMSVSEHQLHLLGASSEPYCILPAIADGEYALGIPGHSKRTTGSWELNSFIGGSYASGRALDSCRIMTQQGPRTYVGIFNPITEDLELAVVDDDQNWTNLGTIDNGVIRGYPSLVGLPNGSIAVSYMVGEDEAGPDNRLRYGVWEGGSFTVYYDSPYAETGYQSALALDDAGNPLILSLKRDDGMLLFTHFDGSRWQVEGVAPAATEDGAVLRWNTVAAVRVGQQLHVVWAAPGGGLMYGRMAF